jgi:leader peptidase (prepilin peptidase)/N-methyltransferase
VILGAAVVGAGAGTLLPRPAYRYSVPAGCPPRAGCEYCEMTFRAGVRGWMALGNRCGNCRRNLGPRWLLLGGLLCSVAAVLAWRVAPVGGNGLVRFGALSILAGFGTLSACIDVAVRRLPTPVVVAAAVAVLGFVGVAASVSREPGLLIDSVGGGLSLAGAFLLLALVGGGGMGMGDVRFAGMLGLALGTVSWATVLLGAVLPYLLAVPSAVTRLRHGPGRQHLPFGPYLVAGALLAACVINT